jgi:hypothetical protein
VEEYRAFACRLCGKRVLICKRCDRGHRYCSPVCSRAARLASIRQARRRYQRTDAGRRGNARRQRELYRRRHLLRKNLTHQGSAPALSSGTMAPLRINEATLRSDNPSAVGACGVLTLESKETSVTGSTSRHVQARTLRPLRCHFCGRVLGVRIGAPLPKGGTP